MSPSMWWIVPVFSEIKMPYLAYLKRLPLRASLPIIIGQLGVRRAVATAKGTPPTSAADSTTLLGNYMAWMLASVEGGVNGESTEAVQNQAVLTHPHSG